MDKDTHTRKDSHVKMRQRLQPYSHKPRNNLMKPPEAGRGKEMSFPEGFRGSRALPTPWLQTSDLQNAERVHFCCSKSSSSWYFVPAALGDQHTIH